MAAISFFLILPPILQLRSHPLRKSEPDCQFSPQAVINVVCLLSKNCLILFERLNYPVYRYILFLPKLLQYVSTQAIFKVKPTGKHVWSKDILGDSR